MVRSRPDTPSAHTASPLLGIQRGEVLGLLPRGIAERGYSLYQERRISRITWTGDDVEAAVSYPTASVRISGNGHGTELDSQCSVCSETSGFCAHAAATLLQWLDIRPTMQRLGPGTIWRSHSRHPFLAPSRTVEDRVDLSHLTGPDLRSALELQLSLQRSGSANARIKDGEVEIQITLPSGDNRVVAFSASLLPSAVPLLRSLPSIQLDDELAGLELSEARLHPVLSASWNDDGILLEPGYKLASGTVLSTGELADRIHGRWARLGGHLCLVLDPATPLVPFHRKGRQVLKAKEALRFLNLDHPQLLQHPWYLPQGHLASFRQPIQPVPCSVEAVHSDQDRILLRPSFAAGDHVLDWSEVMPLITTGFARLGGEIVRAPDLNDFEQAGFKLPKKKPEKGLVGSRLAFIRLIADTGLAVSTGDEALQQLAAILQGKASAMPPEPHGLTSELRPYQREGLAWLWSHYLIGVGALLADDMGLGKTHQIMGLLCLLQEAHANAACLVVCPRGVLEHWSHLLAEYAPGLRVCLYHGPSRRIDVPADSSVVVLTTYDIIFRSTEELSSRRWEVAVFDEAQRIKNPRTKAARAARKIPANHRVALTGTPLENRLVELWSVIDLIVPGFLGSERDFRNAYRSPSHHQLHRLRQRLSVLTLRRLKGQVLSDLPDKVEDLRYCSMRPGQAELYRSIHGQQVNLIAEQLRDTSSDIPYMHIFALLTKLKQTCDHPALVSGSGATGAGSGKLEVFEQILDEALEGDHRVVVFSQYVKMVTFLDKHLDKRGISHLVLTGETQDRGRIVRRFNSEQHERVLLASLLAGGVGIDLTGASVVIHYDRWWNPAKENQATDRVHRIGQKRFVQVFKLITRNTIEERIDEMIRRKVKLFEDVVAPTEEIVRGLNREELAEILDIKLG